MIIDENNYDIFYEVPKITNKDYDIKWTDSKNLKGYVDAYILYEMLRDLYEEVGKMKLDNYDLKVLDEAQDLLRTDIGVSKYPSGGGWVERDNLISMIEEFISTIEHLREEPKYDDYPNEEEDRERYVLGI